MNIIGYAKTQMERFDATKFSAVDSLALSQFAYIYFNGMVPELSENAAAAVRIAELLKSEYFSRLFRNVFNSKNNRRLLLALGTSPRFRDIQMCFYVDDFDIEEQKQFSAVTFLLDDETAYVAYRGTDMTFVGWKEDFNMAFISPVPAQVEGVSYLNAVAERIPHKILVGGHSKGGNIAVYSAMNCMPAVQERIERIYSHDGPGFRDEILKSESYERIKCRIHKTMPQSALVGMLFQHLEDYNVVESKSVGLLQHDPFSWRIENGDFHYAKAITGSAENRNVAIRQWLDTLDDNKRELFISTLYSVIEAIGVVNFSDLPDSWRTKMTSALAAARDIDVETKQFVSGSIKSLVALAVKNYRLPKLTSNKEGMT